MKTKLNLAAAMLVILSLLTGGCVAEPDSAPDPTAPTTPEEVPTSEPAPSTEASAEESLRIAEGFLRVSPTFTFDGIEESVRLEDTIAPQHMPDYRVFLFTFDSRHAGYGDRTGQGLAEVITPHKVAITVDRGKITLALMDRKWDMLTQKEVSPG
ncbi:hypothetical protein ACFLXG_00370 [Chloroflexota bacterium]